MRLVTVEESELVALQLIPHRSVLNSSNRRLWRTLHDLMVVDDPLLARFTRRGGRWVYRRKNAIWWIVAMRAAGASTQDAAERQIAFYVVLPKPLAEVFQIKLANHEQWGRCTAREVPLEALGLPADPELYELRYGRADMFSLDTDFSRQASPIRDVLHVSHEMQDGDSAAILLRLEAVGRRRWQGLADYAWSVWDGGRVPQRSSLDPRRLALPVWHLVSQVAAEIQALIGDTLQAVERAFFASTDGQLVARVRPAVPDPERQALLVNGTLSQATLRKRNLPVFKTDAYFAVGSPSAARRTMIAHSLASAIARELAGDNTQRLERLTRRYVLRNGVLSATWKPDPNLMSTDEVGRLIQLPTAEVQDDFRKELEANRAVEVPVPAPFRDASGIFAGTAEIRGQRSAVHIPTSNLDMLMTPRVMIGSPRMGKDQAAINLVVESKVRHGIGAVVLDAIDERGHRGMSDAIRDHLPPECLVDLNLGDWDHPVAITLDGITTATNERIAGNRVAQELTSFLMGDDLANHQTREFLREAAKAVKGDLLGIQLMLTNPEFRRSRLAELKARGRDVTLLEDFDAMSEGKQGQIYGPVLVRLGEILGDEALRPMFCQRRRPELDLARWLREGRVVIYRVPTRDLGEMAVRTLCHWICLTVFLCKLSLGGSGAPTWFVANEPHQFLSPGFVHFCKRMLAEGPKHRLAPVFLFHNFRQFGAYPDFVDILLSSSLNWHIFKNTNDQAYRQLVNYLQPTFTPESAMQATKRFEYIACWLDQDGEYQPPFLVQAPPLVGERYPTRDHSYLTRRHSNQYGRPIAEVEAEIQARLHHRRESRASEAG